MGEKKILLIDYDQSSLATIRAILAKEGYEVITAADGQTGWDKYIKETPGLVLMEAMLPKVHGFELCQRITSEKNSKTTVFIMTGVYKDRVYRTEALRTYGASEYFEKPLKMAEILVSIEAVLGKPEIRPESRKVEARLEVPPPVPAAPAWAKPAREVNPYIAPAGPPTHEKPRSDDSLFSLPDDLDRLSREIPKARIQAQARRESSAEPRPESVADQLLKTVIESSTPKTVQPNPGDGNGNGSADIDLFLKSALAGLDISKEKIKVPKTAPLPSPPVQEKPSPTPPQAADFKPMPTTSQRPAAGTPVSEPGGTDMKSTLTPGDPGSDVSPFFAPKKPMAFMPVAKPEKKAAPAPEPILPKAPRREPVAPKPPEHEPARQELKDYKAEKTASPDIFSGVENKDKKGFPKLVVVGIGIVALAVVGFILLRPKHSGRVPADAPKSSESSIRATVPAQPAEEAPVAKPEPEKPKTAPKAVPADPGPARAEAILPAGSPAPMLPLPGTQSDRGTAVLPTGLASNPIQADPPAARTNEATPSPPEAKANPLQSTTTIEAGGAEAPGLLISAPAPVAPPVREGDLVELGSVTEPPKLLKSSNPVYPQAALTLGISGSVTVNALINEKGNVTDTAILKGIQDDKGLGKAAEAAMKKWRFQPARKNGVAVKVWKPFVINFKADANTANSTE